MTPLSLVTAFLLLLSLFAYRELGEFVHVKRSTALYKEARERENRVERLRLRRLFGVGERAPAQEREGEEEGGAASLKLCEESPPNSSRFNLRRLYEGRGSEGYRIAAALLRRLYGELDFFRRVPHAEYALLDSLLEQRAVVWEWERLDALGTLSMGGEALQEIWYHVLKGGGQYPSLFCYLTFESHVDKVNLAYASRELLEAMLDRVAGERLWREREALWERMRWQEAHRSEVRKEGALSRSGVQTELKEMIQRAAPHAYGWFSYSLEGPGSLLLIFGLEGQPTHRPLQ